MTSMSTHFIVSLIVGVFRFYGVLVSTIGLAEAPLFIAITVVVVFMEHAIFSGGMVPWLGP